MNSRYGFVVRKLKKSAGISKKPHFTIQPKNNFIFQLVSFLIKMSPDSWPLFPLFTKLQTVEIFFQHMLIRFELLTFGVRSDRCTNWATDTALILRCWILKKVMIKKCWKVIQPKHLIKAISDVMTWMKPLCCRIFLKGFRVARINVCNRV